MAEDHGVHHRAFPLHRGVRHLPPEQHRHLLRHYQRHPCLRHH